MLFLPVYCCHCNQSTLLNMISCGHNTHAQQYVYIHIYSCAMSVATPLSTARPLIIQQGATPLDHARPRSQSMQALPVRHAQSVDSLPHARHHPAGSSQLSSVPEDGTPRPACAAQSMDVLHDARSQRAGSGVQAQQATYSQPSASGAAQADFVVNGKGYSKLQV